jgi:hypothetical protein
MGAIFNDDFREFVHALNKHDVQYMLYVGRRLCSNPPWL